MAEIDDLARSTIGPTLRPGEVLLSIGWMAVCASGWRDLRERYIAIGTNQRLVVIQTGKSFMHGVPDGKIEGMNAYELAPLAAVVSHPFAALTTSLVLQQPGANASWAIPATAIIGAKSVDGHADFVGTYIPWLRRHVAAGTLRTAEGAAAAAAEWQNRAAITQANERYLASIGDKSAKSMKFVMWPALLAIVCLGLIVIGWAYKKDATEQIRYPESHIDFIHEHEHDPDIQWDPAVEIANDRAAIDKLKSKQTVGTLIQAGSGMGAIGLFILSFVLTSKKRARAKQAAQAA